MQYQITLTQKQCRKLSKKLTENEVYRVNALFSLWQRVHNMNKDAFEYTIPIYEYEIHYLQRIGINLKKLRLSKLTTNGPERVY